MNKFYLSILVFASLVVLVLLVTILRENNLLFNNSPQNSENDNPETENPGTNTRNPTRFFDNSPASDGSASSDQPVSGSSGIDPLLEPHYCAPSSRELECDETQDVVCGWFDTQTGCTGPCVKLFVNPCQACIDERVDYWTLGDCPIHG